MNEGQWRESSKNDPAIGKAEARPIPDENNKLSRREALRWQPFLQFLKSKLKLTDELVEEYAKAKVAQEANAAQKTLEEAAEIAARASQTRTEAANQTTNTVANSAKTLAEAKKIDAETAIARQDAFSRFLNNIERISTLPEHMQAAAMEQLLPQQSDAAEQLDRIEYLLEKLRLERGLSLTVAPDEEKATQVAEGTIPDSASRERIAQDDDQTGGD